jgi:nitrite reductase/ring-hydroxylating ferredoxin subunit
MDGDESAKFWRFLNLRRIAAVDLFAAYALKACAVGMAVGDSSLIPSKCSLAPFPNGWFFVAFSKDIKAKTVKPIRYFGKDLVVFRTADGRASVLDAHCPHLGAHLGHGGRVDGDCVVCPFHAWKFDADGRCAGIPYARKIPPAARLRAWPVQEVNGLIMVYYHERGDAPDWQIPELEECVSADWHPFDGLHRTVRVHLQEMMENIVDLAHFPATHGFSAIAGQTDTFSPDGPFLTYRARHGVSVFRSAWAQKLGIGHVESILEAKLHGLGFLVARTSNANPKIKLRSTTIQLVTPIDEHEVEIHQLTSINKLLHFAPLDKALLAFARSTAKTAIMADIPIWENKVYRDQPVLCDGDGPIVKFRRWARQFYPNASLPLRESIALPAS